MGSSCVGYALGSSYWPRKISFIGQNEPPKPNPPDKRCSESGWLLVIRYHAELSLAKLASYTGMYVPYLARVAARKKALAVWRAER